MSYARIRFVAAALMVAAICAASTLSVYAQAFPEGAILGGIGPRKSPFGSAMERLADKLGAGNPASAPAEQARQSYGREPTKDEIYFFTALNCRARKNSKGFFTYMNAAIAAAPKNWVYRSLLGDEYRKTGQKQKAVNTYLAAAKAAESGDKVGAPITNKMAADMMLQLGRYSEAEKTYETSLAEWSAYGPEIESRMTTADTRKAWAAARAGAMQKLVAAKMKLAPKRTMSQDLVKPILQEELPHTTDVEVIKQAEVRVHETEPALRKGEFSGSAAHVTLAEDYRTVGKYEDSLIELLAAQKLEPTNKLAWRLLGAAYLRQRRLNEAVAAYSKAGSLGDSGATDLAAKVRALMPAAVAKNKTTKGS